MSIKAYSVVVGQSRHHGDELLLLIFLADSADESGIGKVPSSDRLSAKMRMPVEAVGDVWRGVVASGELTSYADTNGVVWFRINLPSMDDAPAWFGRVHGYRDAWRNLSPQQRRDIFARIAARDGAFCRHCGRTSDLTLDHIKPLARGGTSDDDNLQLLCRSCNSRKGDR